MSVGIKILLISFVACLIVVLFILVAGSPVRFYRDVSPSQMRSIVSSELPNGSSASQVVAFLNARGVDHSSYSSLDHEITAAKRNACLALLLECTIGFRFSFDEGGKLQRVEINESFTGL